MKAVGRKGLMMLGLLVGVGLAQQPMGIPQEPPFREMPIERRATEYADRLRMLYRAAESLAQVGDFEEALRYYEEALELQRRHRDRRGMRLTLMAIGDTYLFRMEKPEPALEAYARALEITRQVRDRKGEPEVLHQMAYAYYVMGRVEDAERLYHQTLELSQKVKNRRAEGNALNGLGNCLLARGRMSEALAFYERALEVRTRAKDRRGVANTAYNVGRTHLALGHAERAIEYLTRALALRRELLDVRAEAETLFDLARAVALMQRFDEAASHFRQAAQLAQRARRPRLEILAWYGAGAMTLRRAAFDEAIALFRRMLDRVQALGAEEMRRERRLALGGLGAAYFQAGRPAEAEGAYVEGVRLAHAEGDRFALAEFLVGLGQVKTARTHYPQALACYFQARDLLRGEDSPLARLIEKHLGELRMAVGAERFSEMEAMVRTRRAALLRELTGLSSW